MPRVTTNSVASSLFPLYLAKPRIGLFYAFLFLPLLRYLCQSVSRGFIHSIPHRKDSKKKKTYVVNTPSKAPTTPRTPRPIPACFQPNTLLSYSP